MLKNIHLFQTYSNITPKILFFQLEISYLIPLNKVFRVDVTKPESVRGFQKVHESAKFGTKMCAYVVFQGRESMAFMRCPQMFQN